MIKELFHTFRKPSAASIAQRDLEEAQRELLAAQTCAEYANGLILFRKTQITRLQKYIAESAAT